MLLCYAMLCYAVLCYAMLCYAVLCYALLCFAWHTDERTDAYLAHIVVGAVLSSVNSTD